MRASTKFDSTTTDARGRTTCEARCISIRPLPPEPLFPLTAWRSAVSTWRVRKSSKATRRMGFSKSTGSKRLSLVRTRTRGGGGKRVPLHPIHEQVELAQVVGPLKIFVGAIALAIYAVECGSKALHLSS